MSEKLNKVSSRITQPRSQGASQAMLYATGMTRADMDKAQVGIASMWWEGNPCNMHLNDLAGQIATGVREAGLIAMRFNTIGVSDGISMGTEGMKASLVSREVIADSMWRAIGWICDERQNAVIDTLRNYFRWRSPRWWQATHAKGMRDDSNNYTRWTTHQGVWYNRGNVWDKIATDWAGEKIQNSSHVHGTV